MDDKDLKSEKKSQKGSQKNRDANEQNVLEMFPGFGAALRYARTTFAERMFHLPEGVAPPELSSRKLIACLTEHGYPISSGAFSSIESGNSLPRDPEGFLRALFACLGLNANEGLGRALTLHLAYDLLQRDLGKYAGLLDQVIPEEFRRRMQKPEKQ